MCTDSAGLQRLSCSQTCRTGQPSVQLAGRSVFTRSVRFSKGRMYINSSFSRYLLCLSSSKYAIKQWFGSSGGKSLS